MHRLNEVKESLMIVFNKPIYVFSAAIISFLIFSLFIFLTNIPIFLQAWSVAGISLFPKVSLNIINTILSVSGSLALSLMVAIAIVGGINISMIIFKFAKIKRTSKNLFSFGALASSMFGAGCPACSTSLLSILGVSGGLSVLPLKGVEFTSLGLLVLLISFYFIGKSINECKECKISQ